MTAKKWFGLLFWAVVSIVLFIAATNFFIDPFGAFSDIITKKHSMNMTNNPKTAKISYIDANFADYNAYILGASGSSSLSVEKLNEYTGLRWYNMFNYGADMAYTLELARYLVKNCEVEHFILNLTLINAEQYNLQSEKITERYSPKISGTLDYFYFLFANPNFAFNKVKNIMSDVYLQQSFDVFIAETGSYDKSVRDIEPIGILDDYLSLYPEFKSEEDQWQTLRYISECIEAVASLKELCLANGIELTVIIPPLYEKQLSSYDHFQVSDFFSRLADVTDFFDFSSSLISGDPRFFYDTTHFRNCAGDMMLAVIFNDTSVYVPQNLGVFVNKENIAQVTSDLWKTGEAEKNDFEFTVLMYHHLAESGDSGTTVSPAQFEEHMKTLSEAGYTAVSLDDLVDYVYKGKELPEKTIVITIDDGYSSNYEIAFPILKKYGFHATIFTIGVSVGKDTYKDTGKQIIPHFGTEQMWEMSDSGFISIQSHTFDMHHSELFDKPFRQGVLQMNGESEAAYIEALRSDYKSSREQIEAVTGQPVFAFSYPFGYNDKLSAVLLYEMGVKITFTTTEGRNAIIKGIPQSLLGLNRYNIHAGISADELLKLAAGN